METTKPSKILIVDDNENQRTALTAVLEDLGEQVIEAASGREALRCVLNDEFAVILLDVNMPGLNGFETAALIRQRPSSEHTPIIFVTAYSDDALAAHGYSLGAVDYILSPVQPEVLRTKVSVFLELHRQTQELTRQRESLRRYTHQLRQLADASLAINSAQSIQEVLTTANASAARIIGARESSRIRSDNGDSEKGALTALVRRRDGANVGTIQIVDKIGGPFTPEDETILVQLAQMASIAVENLISAEAREANRLKDEFLGVLSHELRTPLQAILIWIRLLRGNASPEMLLRGLEIIERSAGAQQQIIDDLLDISRIIRGNLRLEMNVVDAVKVIDAAVETVRPIAASKEITIEWSSDDRECFLTADAHRLQQAVWNLVANAVKFTPKGGRVGVDLEAAPSQVRIEVWDTGPGIPQDFLPYVFERFRQADSTTTRRHNGLGLGLAIVRHLVELHGGKVEASNNESTPGALFTITLSRSPHLASASGVRAVALATPPPTGNGTTRLDGIRVVLVEDDNDARECLKVALEHYGANVVAVESVANALEALETTRPDLLLSDLGMPDQDGYTLIQTIRNSDADRQRRLPAAALTAYVRAEDRLRALEAGFDMHVEKPIEAAELAAIVQRLARRSKISPS